jgi:hypothetical protein
MTKEIKRRSLFICSSPLIYNILFSLSHFYFSFFLSVGVTLLRFSFIIMDTKIRIPLIENPTIRKIFYEKIVKVFIKYKIFYNII